jgi:RND family efflux transporter MFP subunit
MALTRLACLHNSEFRIQNLELRFCLLALLLLFIPACGEKAKPPPPPPPTVSVMQPVQQRVTDFIEATGTTQAIMTVQLRARVAGYLEKVFFKDGQIVKEGEPLFLIQQNTYRANLQQAEAAILQQTAQLRYASTELERYTKLLQQKAAAPIDVDNWRYQRDTAEANLISAKAKRELAALDVAYTEVTAPFDGRIDRRLVDPGNLVGSGDATSLAQISRINPIYVYFNISDADLTRLMGEARWNPSQVRTSKRAVHAGLVNEQGYPHRGELDFASISVTPTTGSLLLRGIFHNPDGKILPGLYTRVQVPVTERLALLVPEEAVGNDQRGAFLFIANTRNIVERRAVKTGPLVDHLRVIDEGVTGNEWVIVKGLQKAVPGRPVTPQRQASGPTAGQPAPSSPGARP